MRQILPRGTDAPISLKGDRKLHRRNQHHWGGVSDALAANSENKAGSDETKYRKLLGVAIFALRGVANSLSFGAYGSMGEIQ